MPEDCLICREQRGDVELPGGPLWDDELVVGFHVPPIDENPLPALQEALDLERDYSAVIGHDVPPHLHVHLFPRYRGTPSDLPWFSVDDREGSPHGEAPEIAELVERLRARIDA